MNLGYIWASGSYQTGAEVKIHVTANCPYQIEASLRNLKNKERGGRCCRRTRSWRSTANNTVGGSEGDPVWEPTPPSGVDVPIGLQVGVKNLIQCPAGQYQGTLVITVMLPP